MCITSLWLYAAFKHETITYLHLSSNSRFQKHAQQHPAVKAIRISGMFYPTMQGWETNKSAKGEAQSVEIKDSPK